MAKINIKGHEINAIVIRDSFNRRALQYNNNIINILRKVGLTEDDIFIDIEPVAFKKVPASASWYFEGFHMHYSYKAGTKYVENLYYVFKIIELEVNLLLENKKTVDEFIHDFCEDHDIIEQRKKARETLGLSEDMIDIEVINKAYKELAKIHHPDKDSGDTEKFKEINRAHKMLKRELM